MTQTFLLMISFRDFQVIAHGEHRAKLNWRLKISVICDVINH